MENIGSGGGGREIPCPNTRMYAHTGTRVHMSYLASDIYYLSRGRLRKKVKVSLYVKWYVCHEHPVTSGTASS